MPGGKQHFDFQVTFLNSPCLALFLYHRNTIKVRSTEDFAKYHPSGSLGKKLTLTVKDLVDEDLIPGININSKFKDAIEEISSKM